MDSSDRTFTPNYLFLTIAAASGFLTVALGAFAAHGLKKIIPEQLLQTFLTGVEYQGMHTLALLMIALLPLQNRWSHWAGLSLVAGIVLFSGSLYVLALTGYRSLGIITPFGGLFFLVGWGFLVIYAFKQYAEKNTNH